MLKSYAFDVDANLFFTDTTIFLEKLGPSGRKKIEVSQKDYEELIKNKANYRYVNNNIEQSMINFRGPGKYEQAIFDAISQGKLGPSYGKFLEANRYGSPIGIITARGHPIKDLRNTHRKIIYDTFTEGQRQDLVYSMKELLGNYKKDEDKLISTYLNYNYYAPCSNDVFLQSIKQDSTSSLSLRKNLAFEQFISRVQYIFTTYYGENFLAKRKIRIGFSDDTNKNIDGLHEFIYNKENGLMRKYPNFEFMLYNTNTPEATIKFEYINPEQ